MIKRNASITRMTADKSSKRSPDSSVRLKETVQSKEDIKHIAEEFASQRRELEMQYRELQILTENLKAASDDFELIYQNPTVGYMSLDKNTMIHATNETGAKILGEIPTHLKKKLLSSFLVKEDRQSLFSYLNQSFKNAASGECELTIDRQGDQRVIVSLVSLKAYNVENGTPVCHVLLKDITQKKQAEQEVEQAKTFLNSVVENIPDMVFVKDAKDLKFVQLNKAGEALLGFDRKELIGKNDFDFFPREEANFFTKNDRDVIKNGKLKEIEQETIHTRQKGTRILHTKKVPIFDSKRNPKYLLGISEDITDRIELKKQLWKTEKDLSVVTGNLPIFISYVGPDQRYRFVNDYYAKFYGYTKENIIGKHVRDVLGEKTFATVNEFIAKALAGESVNFEKPVSDKHGNVRWINGMYHPDIRKKGTVEGYYGLAHDITERKKLEKDVLNASDTEQQRIGRELHDGLGQNLLAIALLCNSLKENLKANSGPLISDVDRVVGLAKKSVIEIRHISRGLYAADLDSNDLESALKQLVMNFGEMSGLSCDFKWEGQFTVQDLSISAALFRIVQEALNNVMKHSHAKKALVRVGQKNGSIQISVEDDGEGMPENYESHLGMGLRIMKYRAQSTGGTIQFQRLPEKGTLVSVSIPYSLCSMEELINSNAPAEGKS